MNQLFYLASNIVVLHVHRWCTSGFDSYFLCIYYYRPLEVGTLTKS
jgi:hypothetical protein